MRCYRFGKFKKKFMLSNDYTLIIYSGLLSNWDKIGRKHFLSLKQYLSVKLP